MRAQLSWWFVLVTGLLVQTTLLPYFVPDAWRPDVTRSLVLWAALTGLPRGGAMLAFAAGLGLEAATGAPTAFGVVLRLALFGMARPFRGVFFDDYPALLLPVAVLASLADALSAWTLSWFALPSPLPAAAIASVAWRQSLAEAATVPLVFLALELLCGRRPPGTLRRELAGGLSA